jgi:HD-like signal output (HDOD) protein/CheY-like chemotaxis protein
MKRILFVDDDIPLLEGLRVLLRQREREWTMRFVNSGAQALAEFQTQPYDVIVSDIRMPGMHGTRLLRTVSERWPEAARIALSGVADPEQAMHLAPIAHQFLSKPCDSSGLEQVIDRYLRLQELLPEPALRAMVGRTRRLPPLRRTYAKLQSAVLSNDPNTREVTQIVGNDTIIAAKVLQLANSAFFRPGRCTSNIDQAVSDLGVATLRRLVTSAEVFAQWPPKPTTAILDFERLQLHTQAVTSVAQALTMGTSLADDVRLAALLHDIGYWILAHECPRELERARHCALEKGVPMNEAERQAIGISHAEIGGYLLGIWGLPEAVVAAVAHHHAPERMQPRGFDALAAVVVANALADTDDTAAFGASLQPDVQVGATYLESMSAPFSWSEAVQRAAVCLQSGTVPP